MSGKERTNWEELTPESIEAFLKARRAAGGSSSSEGAYRRSLRKLLEFLPEEKRITPETGREWRQWMEDQGDTPRSINARLSALNSFCEYLGRREFQNHDFLEGPVIIQPELTRTEYLRLLQAARALEQERTYLLIKAMGGAGLRVQELPQLTACAVQAGRVELRYHNDRCSRELRLPRVLQNELSDYLHREGIREGPVFRGGNGGPISRTYVSRLLQNISHEARVESEKATPRGLWNMYQRTREDILNSISILADQAYERILEQEERTAGWKG